MAFCGKCGTQVNDGTKFCPKCGNSMGNNSPYSGNNPSQQAPQPQQFSNQAYQQPQQFSNQTYQQSQQFSNQTYQQSQQQPIKPDSNMILAILSTLFCCLPTGIYAIILANKVDKLYYAGQYYEAEEASQGAKKWSIIGAVLAVVGIFIYVVFFVLLAAGAAASSY